MTIRSRRTAICCCCCCCCSFSLYWPMHAILTCTFDFMICLMNERTNEWINRIIICSNMNYYHSVAVVVIAVNSVSIVLYSRVLYSWLMYSCHILEMSQLIQLCWRLFCHWYIIVTRHQLPWLVAISPATHRSLSPSTPSSYLLVCCFALLIHSILFLSNSSQKHSSGHHDSAMMPSNCCAAVCFC